MKSRVWIGFFLLLVPVFSGCTHEEDLGGRPADGGTPTSKDDASSSTSSTLAGSFGGKAFSFKSGFVHKNPATGRLDLFFSDASELCASLERGRFAPGTTVVQTYGLVGTVPGNFKPNSDDVKYATIKASCPSGASVNSNVESASRIPVSSIGTTSTIEISSLTETRAEGSVDLTFPDGSTLSGTFSVGTCSTSESEKATCL